MGAKIKTQKDPKGFQQNPKKSLDQKLTPKKSHTEFPSRKSIKWYDTKNKNIRNWMFVFVHSSYYLKISFPHLQTQHSTLKTPKNISCFNNNIMQNDNAAGIRGHYHEPSDCFEYPKKSLLKLSDQKKKKILAKLSYPKKSRNRKFETLRSVPSLEIWSTTPWGHCLDTRFKRSCISKTRVMF